MTKAIELEKINGNEIIDFLNKNEDDRLCDVNVMNNSYTFVDQEIKNDQYST